MYLQSASESYLPGCLNTCPQWRERKREKEKGVGRENKDLNQSRWEELGLNQLQFDRNLNQIPSTCSMFWRTRTKKTKTKRKRNYCQVISLKKNWYSTTLHTARGSRIGLMWTQELWKRNKRGIAIECCKNRVIKTRKRVNISALPVPWSRSRRVFG